MGSHLSMGYPFGELSGRIHHQGEVLNMVLEEIAKSEELPDLLYSG